MSDTTQLLEDYIPLSKAAEQPDMPSLRSLQRAVAERRELDGLVYIGLAAVLAREDI